MLQLAHRRGLLKISHDTRVFENVFAIKIEGNAGEFVERRLPLRLQNAGEVALGSRALGRASASSEAAIISSRLRSASTSSAYLKFSTSPCSVMRNCPSKESIGCAKMARCVGPPPRPTVPPAAVKEAQLHAGFARHHVQVAMRAEDLPGAGQHAAVFVGVGVAQHHLLPVVPVAISLR
jgi:hypothetical protein